MVGCEHNYYDNVWASKTVVFHIKAPAKLLKEAVDILKSSLCNRKLKESAFSSYKIPSASQTRPAVLTRECPKVFKSCAATPLAEATPSLKPRLRPARRAKYRPVAIPDNVAILKTVLARFLTKPLVVYW